VRRAMSIVAMMGVLAAVACTVRPARPSDATDAPPADLRAAAESMYTRYSAAIATAQRGAIPAFYHQDGALVVFNGESRKMSREALRERYTTAWVPPQYFAWEDLEFAPVSATQVLVTGGFRWQTPAQPDTSRFIYAALLVATDSGLAIVFEHETLRPRT